jgi:hypothetical protein
MAPTSTNSIPVTMSTARRSLKAQMLGQWSSGKRLGSAPIWLGAPGMAKTAICKDVALEVARELDRSVLIITVFLVDREVPDLRGMALPVKNPDTGSYEYIAYTRAGILPNPDLEAAYDHILLLIDEVPAATLDHIKSVASVFLDYVAGDTVLDPARYFVVGTGNRTQDRSGAARLPSHFVNRVRLLEIEPDVRPWLEWSADPANQVPMLARTFVHMRPALFTSARVPDEANASFCTLRSFTNGIQALMRDFAHDPANVDPSDPAVFDAAFSPDHVGDATALLAGDIGASVAREFITFAKVRHQLTTLDDILRDPDSAALPTDPSALYAQASYVVAWTTKTNAEKLVRYVARLRPDLRVPTVQQMLKREPAVSRTPIYAQMMKDNFGLMQAVAATATR